MYYDSELKWYSYVQLLHIQYTGSLSKISLPFSFETFACFILQFRKFMTVFCAHCRRKNSMYFACFNQLLPLILMYLLLDSICSINGLKMKRATKSIVLLPKSGSTVVHWINFELHGLVEGLILGLGLACNWYTYIMVATNG